MQHEIRLNLRKWWSLRRGNAVAGTEIGVSTANGAFAFRKARMHYRGRVWKIID
jgi:hypothetical protein